MKKVLITLIIDLIYIGLVAYLNKKRGWIGAHRAIMLTPLFAGNIMVLFTIFNPA